MSVRKTINLGRIRPVYKGDWILTNTYAFFDFVTSEGSTYICIKPDGVPSGIYLADDIYWAPLATKGANATWTAATLGEVNLSISSTKPITPATLQKAKAGGVASLNSSGKVPSTQLPMATDAEALAGTSTSLLISAKQLKDLLDSQTVSHGQEVFLESGTFTTGPTTTGVYLTIAGGGGGGVAGYYARTGTSENGYTYTACAGASGGAGEGKLKHYLEVLPDTEYVVVIGTGGLASAYDANAGNGLASSFGTLTCQGGKGGKANRTAGEPGGPGGTRGQNGGTSSNTDAPSGIVGTSGGRNVSGGYGNGGNGGGVNGNAGEPGQNGDNGICIVEW